MEEAERREERKERGRERQPFAILLLIPISSFDLFPSTLGTCSEALPPSCLVCSVLSKFLTKPWLTLVRKKKPCGLCFWACAEEKRRVAPIVLVWPRTANRPSRYNRLNGSGHVKLGTQGSKRRGFRPRWAPHKRGVLRECWWRIAKLSTCTCIEHGSLMYLPGRRETH